MFARGDVDDGEHDRLADLLRSEADALGGVHRLDHVGGEMTQVGRDMLDAFAFLAQDRETIDEAWPGDIVGIYDTGNLKIGDTLTEGEKLQYTGIPSFSPEIFKEVVNKDAMKSKQLEKGLMQLMEEGVAQLFTFDVGKRKVIGTVGALQFEVMLKSRNVLFPVHNPIFLSTQKYKLQFMLHSYLCFIF